MSYFLIVKDFAIAYKGLAEGVHRFEWRLDDQFFAAFDSPEIHGGDVAATLDLEKGAAGLNLNFTMKGVVRVDCDRCLEECEVPVKWGGGFRVRMGEEQTPAGDFDGELMVLSPGEGVLDVAQYIYESVVLALPLKRTHADCTPAGANFVSEDEFERAQHGSEMQKMADNPEWQKLKDYKTQ